MLTSKSRHTDPIKIEKNKDENRYATSLQTGKPVFQVVLSNKYLVNPPNKETEVIGSQVVNMNSVYM